MGDFPTYTRHLRDYVLLINFPWERWHRAKAHALKPLVDISLANSSWIQIHCWLTSSKTQQPLENSMKIYVWDSKAKSLLWPCLCLLALDDLGNIKELYLDRTKACVPMHGCQRSHIETHTHYTPCGQESGYLGNKATHFPLLSFTMERKVWHHLFKVAFKHNWLPCNCFPVETLMPSHSNLLPFNSLK